MTEEISPEAQVEAQMRLNATIEAAEETGSLVATHTMKRSSNTYLLFAPNTPLPEIQKVKKLAEEKSIRTSLALGPRRGSNLAELFGLPDSREVQPPFDTGQYYNVLVVNPFDSPEEAERKKALVETGIVRQLESFSERR